MSTRSLLISYAGYPYTPSSLMPDNGLANLAGALIEAGHETLILDYGTVETIKRLYPTKLSRKAIPFSERVFSDSGRDYKFTYRDMLLLKYLDWHLARHQRREVNRIAQEICAKIKEYKPDFVGFKLWTGDGFCGSVQIAETIKRTFPSLPIIAGGPHVDVFQKLIIEQNGVFDVLTYAEGEETIVKLAECLKGGYEFKGIPNLIYRGNGAVKNTDPKWVE
ncbi:MAG: cobalamin-dependent protein [bacterium]